MEKLDGTAAAAAAAAAAGAGAEKVMRVFIPFDKDEKREKKKPVSI